jgi:hypothetical protein
MKHFFIENRLVNFAGKSAGKAEDPKKEAMPEVADAPEAPVSVEAPKKGVSAKASAERVKLRGRASREKVKPVKFDREPSLKKDDFIELADSREMKKELDTLAMNPLREGRQINAQQWDHSSEAGLQQIAFECREVGIPVQEAFYKSMFAILNNGINRSKNTYLSTNPEYQVYFQQPANYMKELMSLPPLATGFDPEAYAKAYQHLQYIQGVLLKQDAFQESTVKKQEEMGSDEVSRKATDFLRSNYDAFTKAIRERDYATAGVYVVGIWAIYKSAQQLGIFGKDGKGTKYMAYGLALYCGHLFAKNAGYDVLKMAGMRDADYEVKGTPLEAIDNILRSNPQMREVAKDLDYGVVLKMSEVSLVDLDELYLESNSKGIQFIHPFNFPNIFPELAKQWPFTMGIGEDGLSDYTGMSNTKLSTAQREYIRVGKQLYKMALALRGVYDETLKKDHDEYKGKPYEVMINENVRNLAKVRHLLAAKYDYAPARADRGLGLTKSIDEADEHLSSAFEGHEIGFYLERQVQKSGHFEGRMMDYPVVFVKTGNSYRVYLKPSYKGAEMPGRDYIADIPAEAGPLQKLEAQKAIDGVRGRILELLTPLHGAGGKSIARESLKYSGGKWICEITIPGAAEYGLAAQKSSATLEPTPDGNGIDVFADGGVIINLDEEVAKRFPIAFALIPAVVGQFPALQTFSGSRSIKFEDPTSGDRKFSLFLGLSNIKLDFEYNPSGNKFLLLNEAAVLADPMFAKEYTDSLMSNPHFTLNKTADKLKKAVSVTPENVFSFIWDKFTGNTADQQLSGVNLDFLSGSVPDYLSSTVIDITIYESLQRLRYQLQSVTSLKDIPKTETLALHDVDARLEGIYEMLRANNLKMKDWDRADYMLMVVDPRRNAGGRSVEYQRL